MPLIAEVRAAPVAAPVAALYIVFLHFGLGVVAVAAPSCVFFVVVLAPVLVSKFDPVVTSSTAMMALSQ